MSLIEDGIIEKKNVYFSGPYYDGALVAFSTQNGIWYSCRDEFATAYNRSLSNNGNRYIFVKLNVCNFESLAKFIRKVEDMVGAGHSKFYHTSITNAGAIYPSKFWLVHRLKRSLLTAFIKAFGTNANRRLLLSATTPEILASRLSVSTYFRNENALLRFLKGYTRISKQRYAQRGYARNYGWYTTMRCCPSKILVKP